MSNTALEVQLPAGAVAAIDKLALEGVVGTTQEEVAAYLVMRALDDIWRAHSTGARRGAREEE